MNYLSEHNLLEYEVLEEKAAAAMAHHNELSTQIKAAEKCMAEIAVLRTHIVNYAKICEFYVAYRKAGYSKKFREEHEKEILLHQAAKNAFDEMGVKKLPKSRERHNLCQCIQNQIGRIYLCLFDTGDLLDRYMAQICKLLLCQAFFLSGFLHLLPQRGQIINRHNHSP